MRKALLLAAALAVPGLLFIFLKRFGKNEFEVPVFHQNAAEWTLDGCPAGAVQVNFPASRPLAVLTARADPQAARSLQRLPENFEAKEFEVRVVSRDSIRCLVLLRDADHEVLLDSAGRVRGYYDLAVREDADRLILEMKIILKKY